jgi:hypothetical protein
MGASIGPDAVAKARTYFAPDATIEIARATARPRKKGRGRLLVKGRVSGLKDGALDVSQGLRVTLGYGGDRLDVGSAGAKDCKLRGNGTALVRARDGGLRAELRPVKGDPDACDFTVKVKVRDYGDPAVAPLTIRLHAGDAVRQGSIETCHRAPGKRTKLTWE